MSGKTGMVNLREGIQLLVVFGVYRNLGRVVGEGEKVITEITGGDLKKWDESV